MMMTVTRGDITMNQQQFDAIRSKAQPTREDVEALCQEVNRQRDLSQQNLEAYWEEQGKTSEAKRRAEAAEAALAAVPRQAIDALFRQQFGSYPIWFNETWTPIADWLGYKPARV